MWTYAHQGQHARCYPCGTYSCDQCHDGCHRDCTGDPCQCYDDECGYDRD